MQAVSVGMEYLGERAIVGIGITLEFAQYELDGFHAQCKCAGFDFSNIAIIGFPIDRLELDDVARSKEHHEVAQVGKALLRGEDRGGRPAHKLGTPPPP